MTKSSSNHLFSMSYVYHLMATREIFLALLRAYGVSLEEPVANGLCLLSPAAFLDAVIDRHNHNGVMAVLTLGVRDSCLTLIRGVLAAFGTRRAAAYSSRDLGAELPTLLIVAPCSCLDDFDKTTAVLRAPPRAAARRPSEVHTRGAGDGPSLGSRVRRLRTRALRGVEAWRAHR